MSDENFDNLLESGDRAIMVGEEILAMPVSEAPISARGQILWRVLSVLEWAGIPCCISHGFERFPQLVEGDVDCLIPKQFMPGRVAQVLKAHRNEIGAHVVQWFADQAHFIVLAGRGDDGRPVLLQLHVSTRYEVADRIIFQADQFLDGKRKYNGFWVPAADVEFACILANRLSKRELTDAHCQRLSQLYQESPEACLRQAKRLLPGSAAEWIEPAGRSGEWRKVQQLTHSLRVELLSNPALRSRRFEPGVIFGKMRRWLLPRNGYHVVFLGPDGVGKSTTIEACSRDLGPAFLHSAYLTFAPGLLPQKFAPPKPGGPHSLPPRSLPASLLKAAWWAVCYTLGYALTVRPTLARAGLVVNHRYLIDAIVDQKRYRYSGPIWLLRWIWAIVPKPDLIILLDAPAEVIQSRKQEVPFEESARQVLAYRTVVAPLPDAEFIDATLPPEIVATEIEWRVLDRLAERSSRQLGLKGVG